jgi:hypothetical protein
MSAKSVSCACAAFLVFGCERAPQRSQPPPPSSAPAARTTAESGSQAPPPQLAPPKRLTSLPISAYAASLALDDDAVYLLTSHAAYRLVEGEPPQGIRLELGIGATLSQSAFVFWSDGGIWSAPKQGGVTRRLANFSHQPQYFVASGNAFAWVDESEDGLYTIQALAGSQPRVLVSSTGEIRALNLIGDAVYFVQRPSDGSWRLGVVKISGGVPEYATERKGRAPALLAGQDAVYYYDLDQSKVFKRSLDLRSEQIQLENFVCSPIYVSSSIFCACVEGLFEVSKETREPTVLVHDHPGTITSISSNSKLVAWTVDLGQDQLAVDMLPLPAASARVGR